MSGESAEQDAAVAQLREDIDHTRREIDQTLSQIEQRLRPGSLRHVAADRMRDVTAPWRERPGEHSAALLAEMGTRLRELAWLNPVRLGAAAAVVGYLIGRQVGR